MASSDEAYDMTRKMRYYEKLTTVQQGATTRRMLRPRKYGKLVCGGQLRKEMHTHTAKSATSNNIWANQRS